MNTKSTKLKIVAWAFFGFSSLIFLFTIILTTANFTNAASQEQGLSESQLGEFAQNDILFYNPGECISTSSGLCGNNIEEKVWSILRQTLDPLHTAAVFGSIVNEGTFQPVKWEYGNIVSLGTCDFVSGMNWNDLYNGVYDGDYGVGSFGLTSGLSDYLHYVNDKAPDLLQYFKDPSNTCYNTGDELAEKIGQDAVDRLIELEVNYFVNEWVPKYKGQGIYDTFLSLTDIEEAAVYWAHDIEVCADCGYNMGSSGLVERAAAAKGYYEKYKDFTCTASSSSNSSSSSSANTSSDTISGDSITWIGDSYSENSTNKAAVEEKYPGIYYDGKSGRMFANDSQRWGSSGLNIVKNDIKENLRDYLVFALGTNTDAGSKDAMAKNIDDLVAAVKKYNSNTKIILVSPITNNDSARSTYDAYYEAMQKAVEKYDNVYLADWYNVAKDHLNEYFDDHATSGYTDNSTHPNTKGYEKWIDAIESALSNASGDGCTTYEGEYPEYLQGDSKWGSMSYGSGTMADSGCGAASMAMLATVAAGQDIFPNDIADLLGNQYYDSTSVSVLDPKVGEHYGFEVKTDTSSSEEETKTKFREYLNNGYMIHFTGHGCYPGFQSGDYCSPGHVVGIFSIDQDDNVMLADSAFGGNQKVPLDTIAKAKLWADFTAIKGGSTSKNGCKSDGICGNSGSNSIGMDGLTEEEAQKVADYYNSDKVTASNFIGGFIPSDYAKVNCVSFSYWFVSAFTDAAEISPIPSLVGDGSYIADTGLPSIGWETGNDPTAFSIFGGAGSSAWSHTGVVVGSTDDGNILTIEAAYAMNDARVMTRSPSYFSEGVGILAYPGSHFTPNEGHLGNKSIKEIIGS